MSSSSPSSNLGRRLMVGTMLGVLVVAGLLLYGDLRALDRGLRTYDYRYFALALLLATTNYALRFMRWQYYLRVICVSLPRFESLLVFLAGFVMSVTPGKLGEVFKSFLLHRSRGIAISLTAPIVLAERLTDLMALVLLVSVGAFAFVGGATVAVAGAVVAASLWAACAFRPVGDAVLGLVARLRPLRSLEERLERARDSLGSLVAPRRLFVATALATVSWSLECAALWGIVRGFQEAKRDGAGIGALEAVFAYSAPTVAGALALLPGGLGVTEVGMTATLEALGTTAMSPPVATATTLLVRLATLWWAVVLGWIALFVWNRGGFANPRSPAIAIDAQQGGL